MNSMKGLFAVAVLLLASAGNAADAPPADAAKPASRDRLECFAEKTTGSNLRKRICVTAEERERRRKEDQAALAESRRSTAGASSSRGRD